MSARPPVDFEVWQPAVWNQVFTMGVGSNAIVLPGYNRNAVLNPTTVPNPSTRGGRRWLAFAWASDTQLVAGDNAQFNYSAPGGAAGSNFHHGLWFLQGFTQIPANFPIPVIRGRLTTASLAAAEPLKHVQGNDMSLWVPDPFVAYLQILSQVGGEELTLSGVYIETANRETVPPDLWV